MAEITFRGRWGSHESIDSENLGGLVERLVEMHDELKEQLEAANARIAELEAEAEEREE